MIVAIDPNIFIAASRGHLKSEALLDEILEAEKYLEIGVDEENQELQKVYERLANDPDINGTALDFLKWLLDDWERRTEELPASTAHSNFTLLDGLGCGTPVEPHLIAVATESGRKAWLFLVGSCAYSKFLVTRGLHDSTILSKLKSHASYASIDVFTAVNARIHLHTWLKRRSYVSV